jgi:hypothetical protein
MKIAAYIVSALIGWAVAFYFFDGPSVAYASILISYHLYLALLVAMASHEKSLSMSIGATILYHLAFLGFLVGIAYGRTHIPFFFVLRWLIPGLAPFETQWLFSGKIKQSTAAEEARPEPMAEATLEDHEAFREHMMGRDRPFRKAGRSLQEEFSLWLADRNKKKAKAAALAAAQVARDGGSANSGPAAIE